MGISSIVGIILAALLLLLVRYSSRDHRIRWPIIVISLVLYIRYISWRGLSTLELGFPHLLISVPLYVAEVYFLGQLLFFIYQTAYSNSSKVSPSEITHFPSVDVFIVTYNESLNLLRRTAVACLAIKYPKKHVYLLDDGQRPEVEHMAARLGCIYLTRSSNEYAKAGNINSALRRTSGELVVVFDSDHAPVDSFLTETVGIFEDPEVALVQTIQHFYNPDPFQRNLFLQDVLENEQELFFKVIMPGRDRYNATFWTGTGAVLRRSALEQIGGVLIDTITEDFHTSLELHAKGWRSVHLNRALSAGLAPEGYGAYLMQRIRWTQGMFQVWWNANPLFHPGLKLNQRLAHFACVYYFFFGMGRVVFFAAPLTFLLFGLIPLRATPLDLTYYFLPHYLSMLLVFPLLTGWRRLTLASEVYESAVCFFQAPAAFMSLFFPRRRPFSVTPKGLVFSELQFQWTLAVPQMTMAVLFCLGIGLGLWQIMVGTSSLERDALAINLIWACYSLFIIILTIILAWEQPQKNAAHSLRRRLTCELNAEGRIYRGESVSISEIGAQVKIPAEAILEEIMTIKFYGLAGEVLEVPVNLAESVSSGRSQLLGLRFLLIGENRERELLEFLFSPEWAWDDEGRVSVKLRRALVQYLTAPFNMLKSTLRSRQLFRDGNDVSR